MQSALKQHYIPQFYLKRWTVNGKLVEFRRPNPGSCEVKPHRKPPKGTAWQTGVYDFGGLSADKQHHLEKVFFRFVDSGAANALAMLESGQNAWTNDLRQAWAMFLMSLIVRHPHDVEAFKAVYARDFAVISPEHEAAYQRARGPEDPATAGEYFNNLGSSFVPNLALNSLPNLVNHERAVANLMNMHWRLAIPRRDGYFLTSDRPVIRSFLGHDDSHWILPIGPKRLFVAAQRRVYGDAIADVIYRNGWKEVNRQVLRQAVSLGFADDEKYLPLVQKHLAAATRPSLFWSFVPHPLKAPPLDYVP
ncbi:DUF4238 domain-containing protein [Ancylobacter moscoviensis]